MSWKIIKRGLFVTMEGVEKEGYGETCTDFLFQECRKFDVCECDDYWSSCWERFRVKVFNKVVYEGDHYYDAEYVYDVSEMKHLLVISGVLWAMVINLVLIFFFNL
jgi:hypothetical protein